MKSSWLFCTAVYVVVKSRYTFTKVTFREAPRALLRYVWNRGSNWVWYVLLPFTTDAQDIDRR
jgi:hypothetical protein